MSSYLNLPLLLAQQTTQDVDSSMFDSLIRVAYFVGILCAVLIVPYFLGGLLANWLRMREYGWKIGLVFVTLACAMMVMARSYNADTNRFDIPLGVDLKGGVILIYEAQEIEPEPGKPEAAQDEEINMNDLVTALTNRINPSGTKEIVVRRYGDRQVEIIIPEVDPIEVESIKRLISTAGSLEFRIVANARDHEPIRQLARDQALDTNPAKRLSKRIVQEVTEEGDKVEKQVGFWAQAAKDQISASETYGTLGRNALTGEILEFAKLKPIRGSGQSLESWLDDNNIKDIDILIVTDTDDAEVVRGEDLGVVSGGVDDYLNPCVKFRLKAAGAQKFRLMTSQNTPSTDSTPPFYRHLGIVLDERLLSFPRIITTISDSGQITGNFSQEEVDFLVGVLRAGRLPASLKKVPISENQIGSMLGDDTIIKGERAIVISLIAVLLFVPFYYRFAGIVACIALLVNLLLIVALMITLNAPLTLPGLAGLVLTVGMSVDANVLIFERIREEMHRGSAPRMAIRNGFARATTTIVDANLTTLITAIVLYAIGTDQIRGFAVTLIFGILMSMYTAIFCSRIVFDIAERKRWLTKLRMMQIVEGTKIDFLGMRQIAIGISTVVIIIGLVGVGLRGQDIFDIDFRGGTSVTMVLKESMPPDQVRTRLRQAFGEAEEPVQFSVTTISVEGRPDESVYKVDSDVPSVEELEEYIIREFRSDDKSMLLSYEMDIQSVQQRTNGSDDEPDAATAPKAEKESSSTTAPAGPQKTAPAKPAAAKPAAPGDQPPAAKKPEPDNSTQTEADSPATKNKTSRRHDLPSDTLLAWAGPMIMAEEAAPAKKADAAQSPPEKKTDAEPPAETKPAETKPAETKPAVKEAAKEKPAAKPAGEKTKAADQAPTATTPAKKAAAETPESGPKPATDGPPAPSAADQPAVEELRTVAHLTFVDAINAPTLRDALTEAARSIDQPLAEVFVDTDDIFDWEQDSAATSHEWYVNMVSSEQDATAILEKMRQTLEGTPVWPTSTRIGEVAGDTQSLAIAALLASFLGIIGYIWIRFQHVVFGVAAVIALVHDVLVTLGAIAISSWLAKPLGFLLIEEFKISLPIVAALLTIIGYSLNDTIVVFDRVREVRGKSPRLTLGMLNTSINQTLSRTLLTSLTTLIVVLILYSLGGQGIHGFAFALVVGVLVGTYSSVFIASPALYWMMSHTKKGRDDDAATS